MRKPDFFIVGAPKCGTTAMQDYLRQHPDIFMPKIKEIHYFGSDLHHEGPGTLEEYLSLFKRVTEEKRVGETSVLYLYSGLAAKEIKDFEPRAQIIIMLRNPVDKIHSNHSYALHRGNEKIADLGAALDDEENRRNNSHLRRGPLYRDYLGYTEQIKRYVDVFGWDNVHVVIYDDFKRDVSGTYRGVLEFLGVSLDFEPEFRVVNSNKRPRSRALQDFILKPPHSVRALGKSALPLTLRHRIIGKLNNLNARHEPRQPMVPELRKRLQSEFAPEVERLSDLLERDLTHWSKD